MPSGRSADFDETLQFWEDYDVWVRLAMRSPARCLTRPLTLVRDHPGSNTKGRVEALESWVQVSAKLERDRELRRLRPLCRRQHALAAVTLATYYRVTGSYGRAFRTLLRAFPSHPAYPAWWLGLAKTCLRPLLPPTALRVYRRLRARIDQRTA